MINKIINKLKILKRRVILMKLYWDDYNRYKKNAFTLTKSKTIENLNSEISFYSHSIEKGLSNNNIRYGFGKDALSILFSALESYKKNGYSEDNIRFQTGVSAIEQYISVHQNSDVDISNTIKRLEKLEVKSEKEYAGAFELKNKNDIDYGKLSFFDLTSKRHSVREFAEQKVGSEKINNAIMNSILTPSACNRQPWKVYIIENDEIINKTLELQKGFKGSAPLLILVTVSQSYYGSPKERYAAYVDGGMFGMTLIYSLTAEGLATCVLNTTFDLERDKRIRSYLGIPNDEVFAMLIAVGEYPDSVKIPISKRINLDDATKVIN